jgi:hypothetical protein
MDAQDLLCLTVPKADPVLRLLAAHAGHGDGEFGFEEGWEIFKAYSRLPVSVDDGGSTFQITASEADPDTLEVFMGRQLSQRSEFGLTDTRVVGMYFVFDPPGPGKGGDELDPQELWSQDFSSIDDFFAAVENSVGFRTACRRSLFSAVFHSQERTDEGGDA